MVTVTSRSLRARVEPLEPDDLLSLAERTWSPEPDLNLENLRHWMAEGFRLIAVGWWARYGPVQSGPAVYFLLQSAEGRQLPMWVAPGKKVAEFIRQHWQEWQRDGIPFVRIDFVEQPSQ